MEGVDVKHLVISGKPSVGKTTLVREVILPWKDSCGGFYTKEMRGDDGERLGFELVTIDGKASLFASKDIRGDVKYGKYGVDINALDDIGVTSMESCLNDSKKRLLVVDEIGAMEVLSDNFRKAALKALGDESGKAVLATIRSKSQPFTDDIKRLTGVKMIELTRENYGSVKARVVKWLEKVHEEQDA
ncbi:nucleoside-triphosphatase [Elusimicrobiota bacterium]